MTKPRPLGQAVDDEPNKLHLLISHPNESGLAMDQITRYDVPAHFVREVKVSDGDKTIPAVDADNPVGENPCFHSCYKPDEAGETEVEAMDVEGNMFTKSRPTGTNVGG